MLLSLKMSKKIQPKEFKLSDTSGHPNKAPFKCALFAVDVPSDGAPGGAEGKKIRISSAVCDKYLDTFIGMALNIDYTNGMSDHDPRFKVAVIEKVYRALDGFAWVEGYIYAKDFPDVVATIRYYNGLAAEYDWSEYQFGASLEMEAAVVGAEDDDSILDVLEFCGTGAAILFADKAAYKTTSFAAKTESKGEPELKPEEIQALVEGAVKSAATQFSASVDAAVAGMKDTVDQMKADITSLKAGDAGSTPKSELELAQERAAKAESELADLKASKAEPQRKTVSASQSLAKYGATVDGEVDIRSFCAAVDQLNLGTTEAIKLKMQARHELAKGENV